MNHFDEKYVIRLASKDDIDSIMDFINRYWRKGHIMSQNRQLFEYEFLHEDTVQFIIAKDRKTNEIDAIFGYLCSSHNKKKCDIWGSFWKANNKGLLLLGLELAKRMKELTGCRYEMDNGSNPETTIPIRKLKFKSLTVKLKHFYFLNSDLEKYQIANIQKKWRPQNGYNGSQCDPVRLDGMEQLTKVFCVEDTDAVPYKDNWYLEHRFFNHPVYKYMVYGLPDLTGKVKALLIMREVKHRESGVLRIVDYIGDHTIFAALYVFFQNMVREHGYEYVDFYEYNFDERALAEAGFRNREDDENIVPDYFEPYCQKNVDIWAYFDDPRTTVFKADGDQDRPNLI